MASTLPRTGRPRSERARRAILEAAADLLIEGGLAAASIEAIAARASVSKVTIYRWWPTRGAVLVEAYFSRYKATIEFAETGDLAHDLAVQIRALIEAFNGRAGIVMAELIGQSQADEALAETLRTSWLTPRREATQSVLQAAVERGELREDVDLQTLMDQLYAPIYFRLTMRHQPLDGELADRLVRTLLDGARPPLRPS